MPEDKQPLLRMLMVDQQLRRRGIDDEPLLKAFSQVPRERFVPEDLNARAYDDGPLPIGHGVTISQPFVVAKTIAEAQVKKGDRVLEIGTGSGYQTAILATIGCEVYSIEVIPELFSQTSERLKDLGYVSTVHLLLGNGFDGWPGKIKFDAILLSAAPPEIPEKLLNQLIIGGRLVGPEGDRWSQWLMRVTRQENGFLRERIIPVQFVPMMS